MPEGAVNPPIMRTPSRTNRVGATTGVVTSGRHRFRREDSDLGGSAIIAPAEKETTIPGAETAGLPRRGIGNGCR